MARLFVIMLLALSFLLVSANSYSYQAQEQRPRATPKWEYKFVSKTGVTMNPKDDEAEFSRLGEEGWELCTNFIPTTGRPQAAVIVFVFKRPK